MGGGGGDELLTTDVFAGLQFTARSEVGRRFCKSSDSDHRLLRDESGEMGGLPVLFFARFLETDFNKSGDDKLLVDLVEFAWPEIKIGGFQKK